MHPAVVHLLQHVMAQPPPFPGPRFGGFGRRGFPFGVETHVKAALALLVASEFLGCAVLVPKRVRWWGLVIAGAILSAAALWARENKSVEGGILYTITSGHGIVVSDMLSVQAGFVALAIIARFALQHRRSWNSNGS